MKTPAETPFLTLPAAVAGGLRMRQRHEVTVANGTRHPGSGLTGSDISLWLILCDLYRQSDGYELTVRIPQRAITRHTGPLAFTRLTDAFRRLAATEVLLDEQWAPALMSAEANEVPRTNPKVATAPDWSVTFDTDVAAAIRDADTTVRIDARELRAMTSRYSVALYLRYHVWHLRKGVYPLEHIRFGMRSPGQGCQVDVSADEAGEILGYDGTLPWSKLDTLFVTDGGRHPVIQRELARTGIDVDVMEVRSSTRTKARYLRFVMGRRYVTLGAAATLAKRKDERAETFPTPRRVTAKSRVP